MRPQYFNWPATDRDGVAAAQTLGASGALRINGVLATWSREVAPPSGSAVALFEGIQRTVTLFSTGNLSGINFTIAGYDTNNVAVSETIAGPNNTTVETTAEFHIVTSVTANAAVGTAVEIGTGDQGHTAPWRINHRLDPANIGLFISGVTGTVSVDVQYTPDTVGTFVWFDHPTMSGLAANNVGNLAFPAAYVRAEVNTTSTGAFQFAIIQAG